MSVPIWAQEFNEEIKKLRRKAGKYDIYEGEQPSIVTLRKKGIGNCVATNKLFRKILRKHKVSHQIVTTGEEDPRAFTHKITIVYASPMSIWFQSNCLLKEFASFSELIKYAEYEMSWENKGMSFKKMSWVIY